jgi:hypothetical protein
LLVILPFINMFFFIYMISFHIGRVCHGSYHWRCVKPETISHYGMNDNYICDKCNDSTTSNPTYRISNGGNQTKSTDSLEADYQDFVSVPSKTNSTESSNNRYFDDKQRQAPTHKTTKVSELDDYIPSKYNGNEYHRYNSKI